MPTDLIRARARPATPRSNARNANIVAIALTAALVTLQLFGLAMFERSHAQPVAPSQVNQGNAVLCTGNTGIPVSQSLYD